MTVLYDASNPLSASLPAGGLSTLLSGVVVAIGAVLVAVGLATGTILVLLASRIDGL